MIIEKKFVPPKTAQRAAQKVVAWKKQYPNQVKAMTPIGWTRARQLASGKPVSFDVVTRMYKFKRHKQNAKISEKHVDAPWKDKGFVAWEGWGGTSGIRWAEKQYKKHKK